MQNELVEAVKAALVDEYVVGCCVIGEDAADEIARAVIPIAAEHFAGVADAWDENSPHSSRAAAIRAAGSATP